MTNEYFRRTFGCGDGSIEIIIYEPQALSAEGGDFKCEFEILGIENDLIPYSIGVDKIHALLLCLTKIGTFLYSTNQYESGQLYWNSDGKGDLGLPIFSDFSHMRKVEIVAVF